MSSTPACGAVLTCAGSAERVAAWVPQLLGVKVPYARAEARPVESVATTEYW